MTKITGKSQYKSKCDEKECSDEFRPILRINATDNNPPRSYNEFSKKNTIGEAIKKFENDGKFDDPDSYGNIKKREIQKINIKLKVKGIFDWLFGGKKR